MTRPPAPGPGHVHHIEADCSPLTVGFYHVTLMAVFLTTSEIRPPRVAGLPTFTILELLVYPAALCLVAEILARPSLANRVRALYRRNRAIAWYAGYAGMAALIGVSRSSETLQTYKDLLPGAALYALVFLTADSPARICGLLAANLAGSLLSVGLGLCQITTGGPYLVARSENVVAKLDLSGELLGQVPTGILAHPNGFAIALLPVILFLVVAVWPGFGRSRRLALGMLACLGAALVVLKFAYVKGVYAWLAVGLLVIVLPRRWDRWRFGLSVGLVVAGVSLLTWFSIRSYLEGEGVFGTVVGRIELWLACIETIRAHSFVAVLGSGDALFQQRTVVTFEYGNAHNAWLNQALTYGIPALGFYLAGFWVALRSLAQTIRRSEGPQRAIALATMASLTALLGENFFEPTDRGVIFQAQLFTLFALAAVCSRVPPATVRWEPSL